MDIRIGMIGYGEVGSIFSAGLRDQPGVTSVAAWDIRFAQPGAGPALLAAAAESGVDAASGMGELCKAATLIISAVTASSTLEVAQEAARYLLPGTVFLDLNSASPGTKREAARVIDVAGSSYVEAGVMTSVPPYGIRVPMLLGGAGAERLASTLCGWGMDATAVAADIGVASAIKMCRSIMIKGLEALVIESYSTALHYGVADRVLPTLSETFPQIDWPAQGACFFSRVVRHGKRRAEEMRESAATVYEAGLSPFITAAIAEKHAWVAETAAEGWFDGVPKDAPWPAYAERLISAHKSKADSVRQAFPA
jgi:3-hydroxyisobutyrate dehydrogenase-like beta-hydroxyacid dehydrogenase